MLKTIKLSLSCAFLAFLLAFSSISDTVVFAAEGDNSNSPPPQNEDNGAENEDDQENSVEDPNQMNIYFYPLGENSRGDSCIITIGNVEVLIDAGVNSGSDKCRTQVKEKIEEHISDDGLWDYIIVTHADVDHINGLISEGVFSLFTSTERRVGTLIDFDITQDQTVEFEGKDQLFVTNQYKKYANERDALLNEGTKYYASSQCYWDEKQPIGDRTKFDLGGGATLTILYNYYYNHRFNEKNKVNNTDRNLLSVCCLIEYGDHKFLFTGDIEEYDSTQNMKPIYGESQLIENNKEILSGGVTLYKVAHHGSRTSSSQGFIDYIHPEYVVITGCAGSENQNFPSIEVTDRLFGYTDKIYITSKLDVGADTPSEYYGEIVFTSDGESISVQTQYENDQNGAPLPIHRTDWFKENGNAVCQVITFYGHSIKESNCSLVKYGSIDILIDCGVGSGSAKILVDKVKRYCTDGIIELAIVTTSQRESIEGLIEKDGLFECLKFEKLIEYSNSNFSDTEIEKLPDISTIKQYANKKALYGIEAIPASEAVGVHEIPGCDELTVEILKSKFYEDEVKDEDEDEDKDKDESKLHREDDYSVCCLITFIDQTFLFTGDLTNAEDGETYLKDNNPQIKDVTFFRAANYGGKYSNSKGFINYISPKYVVIDCSAGMVLSEKGLEYPNTTVVKKFLDKTKRNKGAVFLTGQLIDQNSKEFNGDVIIPFKVRNGQIITDVAIDEEPLTIDRIPA